MSVTTFSATARYNVHNKIYHRHEKGLNLVFSLQMLCSGITSIFACSLALLSMRIPTHGHVVCYCGLNATSILTGGIGLLPLINGVNYASEKGLSTV